MMLVDIDGDIVRGTVIYYDMFHRGDGPDLLFLADGRQALSSKVEVFEQPQPICTYVGVDKNGVRVGKGSKVNFKGTNYLVVWGTKQGEWELVRIDGNYSGANIRHIEQMEVL